MLDDFTEDELRSLYLSRCCFDFPENPHMELFEEIAKDEFFFGDVIVYSWMGLEPRRLREAPHA